MLKIFLFLSPVTGCNLAANFKFFPNQFGFLFLSLISQVPTLLPLEPSLRGVGRAGRPSGMRFCDRSFKALVFTLCTVWAQRGAWPLCDQPLAKGGRRETGGKEIKS